MPKFKGSTYYDFETTIAGIPCVIAVTGYSPGYAAVREGPFAGPAEGPDVDYVVLDRNWYKADWLAKKITDSDREKIYELAVEGIEG